MEQTALAVADRRGVALRTAYVASEVAVPGIGHADLTATYVAATVRSAR